MRSGVTLMGAIAFALTAAAPAFAAKGDASFVLSQVNGDVRVSSLDDVPRQIKGPGPGAGLDVTGVQSWDGLDAIPPNIVIDLNIGAGNELNGLSWDVGIETLGGSWLEEAVVQFSNSSGSADPNAINLSVGAGNGAPGNMEFSSGGVILFGSVPLPNIVAGPDGILRLQFFESFDDAANTVDANWRNAAAAAVVQGIGLSCTNQAACDAAAGGAALSLGTITEMDMCIAVPANNNGIIEPGEQVTFNIPLDASGQDYTNVVGTLTSGTAGVTILTGIGNYGTITAGNTGTAAYTIMVDDTVACFSSLDLTLSVTSTEDNFSFPLMRDIGQSAAFVYNNLGAFPDNTPAGLASTATVSGVPGNITNVQVQVDATHTWVGDIVITLQSPSGTTITLLDRPGVPASTFGCNNNNISVLFADGQPDPEGICDAAGTGAAWPVTMAGPVNALSAFNGQDANGVWTLTISDNAAGDTGTLDSWELIVTPAPSGNCTVCPQGGDLSVAVTAPGGVAQNSGAYTLQLDAANAGPLAQNSVVVSQTLAGLNFISSTCGATAAGGNLTWNVGTLANGGSSTCTVTVNNQAGACPTISTTATITGSEFDPNLANNSSTYTNGGVCGLAQPADVQLVKTNNATGGLATGDAFSFFINVTNNGPNTATNVVVTDVLSNKVSYVANTCGASFAGNTVTWTIPVMAPGANVSCEIQVLFVGLGDVINIVNSTANEPDPNPLNNTNIQTVASANALPIPALNGFTLAALAALMAGLGLWMRRRTVKG